MQIEVGNGGSEQPRPRGEEVASGPSLRETLLVRPGGTLFVDLNCGSILVESHDRDEVHVRAEASGWAEERTLFVLERRGEDVYLEGDVEASWFELLFGKASARVRVKVRVPRRFSADLQTRGGRIRVRGVGGSLAAETSGGSIEAQTIDGPALLRTCGGRVEAEDLSGEVRARTSGGRIEMTNVAGDVQARTSGGSISLREIAGQVEARTSGGSIRAGLTGTPAGSLETSGGRIEVDLPKGASLDLDAATSGGSVRVESPLELRGESERSRVRGVVGGGGPLLYLRTSGGSIRVREG